MQSLLGRLEFGEPLVPPTSPEGQGGDGSWQVDWAKGAWIRRVTGEERITVSQAAVVDTSSNALGMTRGKFAMWSFLCSDGMGFAGFFAAFFALRSKGISTWDPVAAIPGAETLGAWVNWPNPTDWLNIPLTALNTFILICSSVTMVLALSACQRDDRTGTLKWLGATIFGGMFFLGVQVVEYTHLDHLNILPSVDNFGATFYSLTCYHGAHVFTGVVYLICMFIGTLRGKYGSHNSTPLEIVGLFWHFVDLVWILLFTFVYLLEPADNIIGQ